MTERAPPRAVAFVVADILHELEDLLYISRGEAKGAGKLPESYAAVTATTLIEGTGPLVSVERVVCGGKAKVAGATICCVEERFSCDARGNELRPLVHVHTCTRGRLGLMDKA